MNVRVRLRRPIGRMTMAEQQFEGEFRYVNSRLITNCEEVAFYNGSRREKMIIRDGFERLVLFATVDVLEMSKEMFGCSFSFRSNT